MPFVTNNVFIELQTLWSEKLSKFDVRRQSLTLKLKFDFEVKVWLCWIFEWKFKVDFENDLCSWRWGLNLKFGADVQCWLLKLTFDVDSVSNV